MVGSSGEDGRCWQGGYLWSIFTRRDVLKYSSTYGTVRLPIAVPYCMESLRKDDVPIFHTMHIGDVARDAHFTFPLDGPERRHRPPAVRETSCAVLIVVRRTALYRTVW